jgi:hypothetical protein
MFFKFWFKDHYIIPQVKRLSLKLNADQWLSVPQTQDHKSHASCSNKKLQNNMTEGEKENSPV